MIDILPYVVYFAAPAIDALLNAKRPALSAAFAVLVGWSVFVNATGATMRSSFCWSTDTRARRRRSGAAVGMGRPQFLRPFKVAARRLIARRGAAVVRQLT